MRKSSMAINLLLVVVAASILTAAVFFVPSSPFSILPGFEGLNAGVEGATIGSQFYRVDQTLPQGYTWLNSDPHNTVINKDLSVSSSDARVRIEVGSPLITSDPFSQGKEIDYWVQSGDEYLHVKGEVVTYTVHLTVSAALTGTTWPECFNGEKIWVGLSSVVWDRALQEQSPISGRPSQFGQAWEAPIGVYITEYNIRDPGEHGRIDPAYTGRFITLYSSPDQSGTISDLLNVNLNQTFAGDIRPDSRMQRQAYFTILLEDFGTTTPYSGWFGSQAPVVDYTFKIYALKIGSFTYTNVDDTPWGQRKEESYDPWGWLRALWQGVADWFASPINLAGTFIVLGIALVVGVLVLLFLTGLIVPVREWAASRSGRHS